MPIWNIFGIVGWVGNSVVWEQAMMIWRLADFECLAVNGIRIGVDSGSKVNLRLNMGFGPDGIKGFNINVAEAF